MIFRYAETALAGRSASRFGHALVAVCLLGSAEGCGAAVRTDSPLFGLTPSATTVQVGHKVTFRPTVLSEGASCTWTSSDTHLLVSAGDGNFKGSAEGNASVIAHCGGNMEVSAAVIVTAASPGPLVITRGGTYSGTWTSEDPAVPAVDILTNEPVVLRNTVITGRGDLIDINGTGTGANVTIQDVTGTALDPEIAGKQRGAFVSAADVASLRVEHSSMYGVSFGVKVASSAVSALNITQNLASELDDRASDGNGGLEATRPNLGHFIFLYQVSAPLGAEIAWNQMVNTIGSSSTEDVINIFKSQGAKGAPIRVHDNYMEGYSSTTTPSYTGAGLISDGDDEAPVTAFVTFDSNQMVHTAGSGVEIAAGHDIIASNNHVVSCGMDAQGNWFAMPFVNAVILWNFYEAPQFHDNAVTGTKGGMVKPSTDGQPTTGDLWARVADLNATDSFSNNDFTDPCLINGQINLQAEDVERASWAAKLAAAHLEPGSKVQQ